MIITLSGDLDLSMREAVAAALPEPSLLDPERLVIDCTAVTSIESVVIAVFMRYRRKWIAASRDPHGIVFLAPAALRRTFEITGVTKWFTVVVSEPAAPQPDVPSQA